MGLKIFIHRIPTYLGIDYQTLRDELLAGSRLPSPSFSVPKISHLIQTCWLADPIERPSFTKIKEQLLQSCPVLSRDSENDTSYYLAILSDNSMRDQYKKIQESNPMFEYINGDDNNEDSTDDETMVIASITSSTTLENEPNIDTHNAQVTNNCVVLISSTQSQQNTVDNDICLSGKDVEKEEEVEPLLKTNCCQRELTKEDAFLSQLNIDHNNYLQNVRTVHPQDITVLVNENSLIL